MPHDWLTAPADPCALLTGKLKDACENTQQMVGGSTPSPPGGQNGGVSSADAITDPLGSIARGCAEAAQWVINNLSDAISKTATVNFTNLGFLKQYAIVFAASAILTVLLWLSSVVKRAVRGDSIVTAIGEATGFLWMAVLASAFTPVILAGMVKITDSVSDAIGNGSTADRNGFLASFSHALDPNSGLGGGPIMLIFVSVMSMVASALLWLELIIRAAMLYVGAALATAVYAGFVDRAMWGHIRRWVGLMISIDLVKPIIVIVLSLATAVSSGPQDSFSAVLSGLAIMILSIFASGLVYRFVPAFGDDMLTLQKERAAKIGKAAITSAAFTSPAGTMRNGMAAHGNRMGGAFAGGGGGNMGSAITGMSVGALAGGASAAAGIAAHTGRALTVRPGADGGQGGGGAGGNAGSAGGGGNTSGGSGGSATSASRLQAAHAPVVPKTPPPPRGGS
ncbi:hypothetical protein [Catenulispora pinisilvae]|uniref:hypothetical protein n=1 Tax=Catenulispora pinisilvae TaxID=2705253 RepID=UPI001891DC1D|nr:hypothetical protein [Catenulispora pinisilvae]